MFIYNKQNKTRLHILKYFCQSKKNLVGQKMITALLVTNYILEEKRM